MRAIIQRVTSAGVTVDGQVVSKIGKGYCVLLGVFSDDTKEDSAYILRKLLNIRLFEDPANPSKSWSKSIVEIGGELLMVSQFTLAHDLKKNKPDFRKAMTGDKALVVFNDVISEIGKQYQPDKVQTGVFGAMMSVSIENDGPVTIVLDSREDRSSRSPVSAEPSALPSE